MARMSMLNGGPGLPVFSASVFHYIATDSILCGRMEDVPDPMVRHHLLVLNSVETTEQLRRTVSQQEYEFLINCGYPKALRDCVLDDKTEMVQCVILHYTHYRIRTELDQIKEGLAKVGVLSAIKRRPNIWKLLLCADRRLDITVEYIRQLFEPLFSETGSNARLVEEDLIYNWKEYLKEMGKIRFLFHMTTSIVKEEGLAEANPKNVSAPAAGTMATEDPENTTKPLEGLKVLLYQLFTADEVRQSSLKGRTTVAENECKVLGSETEANLKDLFVFLTGSDRIPPMGFTRKGKIAFDHRDNSQELRFPSVSTCQPMLQLPMCDNLTQDYDSFKEKMNLAMLGSVGFGNP
ncbi:uncharacterized protein [Acropora muricata]|uniref:uncharacterized protein n=1 Tax=Acropora muricata TaxID=159855 RepID=UPI0034E41819